MNAAFYSRIVGILAVVAVTSSAWADPSTACGIKQQNIEAQLAQANAAGRSHQAAGLERALAANQAHCSDVVLEQERQEAIEKAQHKIAEREQELVEAQAKGDTKKIARKQNKLEEARQELLEAQQPLPH